MVRDIIIKNVVTGEQIELHSDSGNYIIDSIDWDSPSIEDETYRVPYQIGETMTGFDIGTRSPSITGYVISDIEAKSMLGRTWQEYYDEQQENILEAKRVLNRIISVYQDIQIQVGGYYLDCRPSSPVKYSTRETENNEVLCMFTINLKCYSPLFYSDLKTVQMATIDGKFRFPLILTETLNDEYVVFGEISTQKTVTAENNGEAEVGCRIVVRAVGGSEDEISIYNVNTGEFIGLEGLGMNSGDTLTINTENTQESVVLQIAGTGEQKSVIGNVTNGSTFLKIPIGEGLFSYQVGDGGSANVLEIYMEYTEKYFNIPEM